MSPVRSAALAVGLVLALLIAVFATRDTNRDRMTTHLVGAVAPAVVGTTIEDSTWDLDDQRGRWVLVNFFSTTCVPCVREHPELVAFAATHSGADDVRIVTVAFDDRPSTVAESYLVTPSGHVAAKVIGGVTLDDLEDLLARAVAVVP